MQGIRPGQEPRNSGVEQETRNKVDLILILIC